MLNEKILVIVQDLIKGTKIKKALISGGFHVVSVTEDPFAAIRILRGQEVHLTIVDTAISKINYIQLAETIEYENLGPVICIGNQAVPVLKDLPTSVYGVLPQSVTAEQLFTTIKMAVRQYQIHQKLRKEVILLKRKLTEKKVVDQAKRLLMEKEGIPEEQAYEKMRKISMNKRVSLRAVAEKVIERLSLQTSDSYIE